ncbi:MAG: sigma-70 family RNA polymerase sigma factor [Hyphomonas sp.]|uniref:RNA polymerase sigma factor n=1 Tax=Hyphomonas sp. TaxID=87 RepID=UPI00182DA957|nr:sigma-70 family RNA polymerase sigma factor [Hyphomonas sp.]MBU3921209.1 sigma-70 family RNA polymerase sigma factor [Alphaproteobacteria bacterium]MBA3069144.1 sigma-70 family RNA polymerase sigma factor [Hyphomonas sp.]MBU4062328.1 sigma-70 family RNA polymerase sigma factor [Alphaproteobacteria bacterium]MBU4162710.1 sigma-70 family RNA polymerase sigma factor [Alphaproteobacteria bacterium]MBU4568017.1 sigma-70 family RNA polymerase sigma factor [Alphaproteobacteria bacterium]
MSDMPAGSGAPHPARLRQPSAEEVRAVPDLINSPPEAEAALNGAKALSQLFRSQYGQLLRFCRVRIRSEADAEDIVQTAFLSARRAYPDKGVEELRPLLFTLVRNLSLNHLKLYWNQMRDGEDISEAGAGLACPHSPTPEKQLMDAQDLAIVEASLSGMIPRRREALRLHRIEGLTYAEIAKLLSVSPTTVKSDVAEAVAEVAEDLARAGRRTDGSAE